MKMKKNIDDIKCQSPVYCHRLVPMIEEGGKVAYHHKKLEYMHSELPSIVGQYWVCPSCKVIDRMRSILYEHRLESFIYYDSRPRYDGVYNIKMSTGETVLVFISENDASFMDASVIIKINDDWWSVPRLMSYVFLYRLRYKLTQGAWKMHPFGSDVDSSELMSEILNSNSSEEYEF